MTKLNRIANRRPAALAIAIAMMMALLTSLASAVDIELAWDAPTENADGSALTDLAGYRVYQGAASGNYTEVTDVGNITTHTLTGLQQGQVYFFATTAYDTSDNESAFSAELQWSMTPPDATDDTFSVNEDGTLTVPAGTGVLVNDTDFEEDVLSAELVTDVAHGSLSLDPDGSMVYTPSADFHGTDTFTYRAHDGALPSTPATVVITVQAQNDAPQANDLTLEVTEDGSGALTLTGSDVDGDSLSFSIVSGPAHGALSGTAPDLTYTPDADYAGGDTLTYRAHDGTTDSADATVTITVLGVNDAPSANDNNISVDEDGTVALTLTGTDPDGDSLTYSVLAGPTHGALSGTAPNLTYTPDANYHGGDAFTFKVDDGASDSGAATVSIAVSPVNDAPSAQAQSVEVLEDGSLDVTLSGTDIDGDSLTFSVTTPPAHGTLTGTLPNLTYTPDTDYAGPDSFSYRADDGTDLSVPATVDINVIEVDDVPPAAPGGLRVHVL